MNLIEVATVESAAGCRTAREGLSEAGRNDHAGRTFYFCCSGCLDKFQADPAKFLNPPTRAQGMSLVTLGMSKSV